MTTPTRRFGWVLTARDEASRVFGQVGTAAGGMSAKMATAAAAIGVSFAGIGATITQSITAAFDQMDAKSMLQAQLGTTNEVAKEHGKIAGELYAHGISGSFQEAADAIKATVQAGLAPPDATNKQLESMAAKATDITNVFGQDLPRVTNAAAQMLRTGLVKSADEAFDVLTKGFQSGANKADDLLDTVNEYSTQFRKAGLDGAQAMGLLSQAIRAGARDSDIAADAIKEFSIRAVDGSKLTADGFKALGLNADDMAKKFAEGGTVANGVLDLTLDKLRGIEDPVKRSQVAVALFGTQAEDLGDALYAMDPSKAVDTLGKVGGAAEEMGKTIHSGPRHQIEVFKRTIEQSLVNYMGGTVIPALSGFTSNLGNIVPVKKIKEGFRQAQVVIGEFFRGLTGSGGQEVRPPALKAPEVPEYLARPKTDAEKFGESVREVGAQLAKDFKPLADAALGIGRAFVEIATHTPAPVFRTIVEVMLATAITKRIIELGAAFRGLAGSVSVVWAAASGPIGLLAAGVLGLAWAFSSASGNGSGFGDTLRFLKDAIVGPYGVWGAIQAIWDAVVWVFGEDGLQKIVGDFFIDLGKGIWDGLVWVFSRGGGLDQKINEFNDWLIGIGADVVGGFVDGVVDAWNGMVHWFTETLPNSLLAWVRQGFGIASPAKKMMPLGADVIRGFLSGILEIASGIGSWLMRNVVNPALRTFTPSASWLPAPGRRLISGLKAGISEGISGVGSWLTRNVVSPVTSRFSTARDWLSKAGGWVVSGFKAGMSAGMKSIGDWLKANIVDPVVSAVKKWFGIKSPSTVFAGIGKNLVAGLLRGLATTSGAAIAKKVFGDMPSALASIVGKGLVSISSLPGKALSALGSLGSKLGDLFSGLFGGGGGGGKGVQRWAPLVSQVLAMLGAPATALGPVLQRIKMESGGNPNAINLWDINAKNGDPSRGLMQTIGSTFNAYAGPFKSRGIYDPLANIYAGINYAMHRYGGNWISVMTRPGGYDQGGVAMGMGYLPKYTPQPERVLSPRQTVAFEQLVDMLGQGLGGLDVHVHFDDPALKNLIDIRVQPKVDRAVSEAANRQKAGRR